MGIRLESDGWDEVLAAELAGESKHVDASFTNFVTHAPMPPRMRNELINRGYARMANRLNDLLAPSGDVDMPPNFFCFAHWASSYVGARMDTWRGRMISDHLENGNAAVFHSMARAFLAFERQLTHGETANQATRVVAQMVPPAARVNSDVDSLVTTGSWATVRSLTDSATGLPEDLVEDLRKGSSCGSSELLAQARSRGFAAYLDATRATNEAERRHAILQGNAWLVISEQAMVDAALTRAMRSIVRLASRPIAALCGSRRSWRRARVGPIRLGIEDAWIELLSKTLEWPTPEGVMPGAAALRFRPRGPASIHRWIRSSPSGLPAGAPFDYFSIPDLGQQPLFWTALAHRLPVIFAVLNACHDGPWFADGSLREHPRWDGFDEQARRYQTEHTQCEDVPTLPDAQRRQDWSVSAELFDRDRELIFTALFTRSLPATYTCPAGAALLDLRAHGMDNDSTSADGRALCDDSLPRLRMSAAFIEAMFVSDSPPGTAADSERKSGRTKLEWLDGVERVHERVRTRVGLALAAAGDQVPDSSLFNDPLGYEQCIGAGVSFVVPVVETLAERFGVVWTQSERDSWSRVWAEITLHQGLDAVLKRLDCDDYLGWGPEAKPLLGDFCYQDLVVAGVEIRQRTQARSLSGVRLADKLRRDLEDAVPGILSPLINVGLGVFGDEHVNRLLLIPRSRFTPGAKRLARRYPRATRRCSRWFIRVVMRELERTEPEPQWDQRFPPGFDPRQAAHESHRRG